MNNRPVWVAFLLVCFLLTGLVGLFASYAASIPLERALYRLTALDAATATGTPDADAIRTVLGANAADLLTGPGELPTRLRRARAVVRREGEREAAAIGRRTRLLVGIVTVLSAAIGAGILMLASRRPSPD